MRLAFALLVLIALLSGAGCVGETKVTNSANTPKLDNSGVLFEENFDDADLLKRG